jgi:hypothetical protein
MGHFESMFTAIIRHLPCLNRNTLNKQRVA